MSKSFSSTVLGKESFQGFAANLVVITCIFPLEMSALNILVSFKDYIGFLRNKT